MRTENRLVRVLRRLATPVSAALLTLAATPALAFTVTLSAGLPSPQLVGTVVPLQVTVAGADPGADIVYQFDVALAGQQFRRLQAYRDNATFNWAAINEGIYLVRVLARDRLSGETQGATIAHGRVSPAISGTPVVLPTAHPQVMIHSSPPCPAGASAQRVAFWPTGNPGAGINATNFKPCVPGRTVTHYVAGMIGNSSYTLRSQAIVGGSVIPGAPLNVNVGASPIAPDTTVVLPPNPATSLDQDVLLLSYIARTDSVWFAATDINGNYLWSYANPNLDNALLVRPVAGGTFLVSTTTAGGIRSQVLREIDLAGNIVRETNAQALDKQLLDSGQDEMGGFHHEAVRLANGHTILLASVERMADQGNGLELVYGEMILDLDANFNLAWSWNAFDALDTSMPALSGETCTNDVVNMAPQGGCPWIWNGDSANDWLHGNAVNYSPADGNLILSARHQNAVYKIDYANGAGSGALIWTLGESGDFTINAPGEVWPWFSHQHDPRYFGNQVVVYDNGNSRQGNLLGATENSRGQAFVLDEFNMTADLIANIDLGHYAAAVGSAQVLTNGNYFYHSGFLGSFANPRFASIETNGAGNYAWAEVGLSRAYRAWRMRTLYAE